MNLSVSKEHAKSSLPIFGADFKIKARLNASEAEVQQIMQRSLGGFELTRVPNSLGPKYAREPLYVGEILNRDWEAKCKTQEDADLAESLIIEACKSLKLKLNAPDDSGPKNIEL
ncbi:MAG: hypothetical protein WDN28_06070 [Chthoniobacter sp.]